MWPPCGGRARTFAGLFVGRVRVTGALQKAGGGFTVDHPSDPENKYLSHSFVESPEMLNVYSGTVTTNRDGVARVRLPAYFEALNRDFRYQLTAIGEFARAMVSEEIQDNEFAIRTDPGSKGLLAGHRRPQGRVGRSQPDPRRGDQAEGGTRPIPAS